MRQLAAAGTILLACLLGFAPSAFARNRYTEARMPVPDSSEAQYGYGFYDGQPSRPPEYAPRAQRHHRFRTARVGRPLSILPRHAAMADLVLSAARHYGVPAALAYGVASVESGFNPHARSRSGAVGLMQMLPSTARSLGCRGSLTNPSVSADCGARYLAAILRDHRGNMRVAAAMYNQGRFARRVSRGGARYAELVMRRARRFAA